MIFLIQLNRFTIIIQAAVKKDMEKKKSLILLL